MKLYLAARYSRRDEIADYASMLTVMGFTITSRWLLGHNILWSGEPHEVWTEFAINDFEDVDKADAVISFTHPRGTLTTGGGRHSEFGYGYAKGKKMIVIGERENIFHHLPGVEVYPDLGAWLAREKK